MPKRKDKDNKKNQKKELIAEDWCFACKDGGELLICDNRKCLKAYHPECVGNDDPALSSNQRWICKWHSCLICGRASRFRCYCCPNAVCRRCIKNARFVRVKEKYGFCNDCLKLAILVEENMDVDSEGETVDLKDRETYEGLFREYYEIIREQEGFNADTVHAAKSRLDLDDSDQSSSVSDEPDVGEDGEAEEEDHPLSDYEKPYYSGGKGKELGHKKKKLKTHKGRSRKKEKSKKMVFDSWGSEALISFLKSIGQDIKEELSPDDVERIILRYVKENKLSHPTKKRKVICDPKLQSLLRKKDINRNRIPKLIEHHFAMNQEESEEEDEISNEIEDGDEKITMTREVERKHKSDTTTDKQKRSDTTSKQKRSDTTNKQKRSDTTNKQSPDKDVPKKEVLLNIPQSPYAAIIPENIKLVYLKKSLVHELCKQPQAFEKKVMGSFVRIKSNPVDSHYRNLFQLEQVTGIRSTSVGEENGEIMLRLSNMPNDICLSMLSDGDFSEEECGELQNKVKAGLLKKLTVVELQEKARSLHEDITKHWIPRELTKLQNLINLANEKGWRRELYEYLHRKQKLQNPSEVSQILQTLPVVIPDSGDLEVPSEEIDDDRKENGGSPELAPSIVSKEEDVSRTGHPLQTKPEELQEHSNNQQTPVRLETENTAMATEKEVDDSDKSGNEKIHKGANTVTCDGKKENQHTSLKEAIHKPTMADVMIGYDNEKAVVAREDPESLVWHICGMNKKNETYNLSFLKSWSNANAQAFKFEVWKEGQSEENAIPLRDALKLAFPSNATK